MRPHSHYVADPTNPKAKGVCDRCGSIYQHSKLTWQFQFVGPKLQNLRFLVCPPCYDKPQPNIRTIVIPPDPIPIMNARPENYVLDDNPLSAIGVDANFLTPQYGSRIGNLTGAGGINAAFDGNIKKQAWLCATNKTISNSSFNNYVGINWQGNVSNLSMPSSLLPPVLQHTLTGVNIYAPADKSFLDTTATSYVIQASAADTAVFGAWTTIASGATAGTAGETIAVTITSTFTNPLSQFHRVALHGDAVNFIGVAQVQFYVAETGGNGVS